MSAYRLIRLFIPLFLVFAGTLAFAQAQPEATKEEIEFWKKKAKEYQTKPLRLKQEFDNYRDQIMELKKRNKELLDLNMSLNNAKSQLEAEVAALKAGAASAAPAPTSLQPSVASTPPANTAEIETLQHEVRALTTRKNQLEADLAACQTAKPHKANQQPAIAQTQPAETGPSRSETELRNNLTQVNQQLTLNNKKLDSMRWENAALRSELTTTKQNYTKATQALRAMKEQQGQGITKPGLVYRLQIGAFVLHEVMAEGVVNNDEFESERADGYNKYVIASCRTYEEATKFRDELRKVGVKDAWIVPYIDGVRVTMQEAADYLKQQGKPGPGVSPSATPGKTSPTGTPATGGAKPSPTATPK
jgi:hypothetical protein